MTKQPLWIRVLRIVARVWSLLSIAFLLVMFIGEALSSPWVWPTWSEWVGLALFPVGVTIGLVLAWWREGLGGAIAVGSLAVFYLWDLIRSRTFPGGPFFLLIAAPGFLFLICWFLSRSSALGQTGEP
jgi:hypothetical protein